MRTTVPRSIGVLLLCAASGCASVDGGTKVPASAPDEPVASRAPPADADTREVVEDFLHAFAQLPGHAPGEATIRFARDALAAEPFVAALERAMRAGGYGVGLAPSGAPGDVRYRAEPGADGEGTVHTVLVGELGMKRHYRRASGGASRPAGPLFVLGADASGIDPDRRRADAAAPSVPAAPQVAARYVRATRTIGDLD